MENVKCSMNMVNVGIMSKMQLNRLLHDLAVYDNTKIERGDIYINVTIDGRKVLGAARVNHHWHVRALEALILVAPGKGGVMNEIRFDKKGNISLDVPHHERCSCEHCRCQHTSGFAACFVRGCSCGRYTWPGHSADLPVNHKRSAT